MTGLMQRRRIRRRAGVLATREYERLKREWQRDHRKQFRILGAIATLVILGTLALAWRHVWPWIGGLAAGAALTFYLGAREWTPAWIENYQIGAWGEERTAKVLECLLDHGWRIVHDLNRIKSNIDHVLVGPGGVFVLDTKNWTGAAEVRGDWIRTVRSDGKQLYRGAGLAAHARGQAKELNGVLRRRCNVSPWVSGVVVLWMEFPQKVAEGNRMAYLHGDHLVEWLLARPAKLNAVQIDQIAAALQPGQRRRSTQAGTTPATP